MRTVIGVMGLGEDGDPAVLETTRNLGAAIAREGWVLLNGGRDAGVMAASAQGAASEGGLVIGVLPDADAGRATPFLDVAIRTGMGEARNAINVLSSDVVIALSGGAGTVSEVALALKAGRPVVTLGLETGELFAAYSAAGQLTSASSVDEAIALARRALGRERD